jgi:hypothetical protein
LTRPETNKTLIQGIIQKDFQRVLEQYPDYPKDISHMRFIDDMAYNPFIIASGIPKQNTAPESWVAITPYRRSLNEKDIRDCVRWCFGIQKDEVQLVELVYQNYMVNAPKENSTPNAGIFMDLSSQLQKLYGYARKNTAQSRMTLQQDRADGRDYSNNSHNSHTDNKENGRETEGEHEDTKSTQGFGYTGN